MRAVVEKLEYMIDYLEKSGDPLRGVLRDVSHYSLMDLVPPLKVLVARGRAAPDDPRVAEDLRKAVKLLADLFTKIERELPKVQMKLGGMEK